MARGRRPRRRRSGSAPVQLGGDEAPEHLALHRPPRDPSLGCGEQDVEVGAAEESDAEVPRRVVGGSGDAQDLDRDVGGPGALVVLVAEAAAVLAEAPQCVERVAGARAAPGAGTRAGCSAVVARCRCRRAGASAEARGGGSQGRRGCARRRLLGRNALAEQDLALALVFPPTRALAGRVAIGDALARRACPENMRRLPACAAAEHVGNVGALGLAHRSACGECDCCRAAESVPSRGDEHEHADEDGGEGCGRRGAGGQHERGGADEEDADKGGVDDGERALHADKPSEQQDEQQRREDDGESVGVVKEALGAPRQLLRGHRRRPGV